MATHIDILDPESGTVVGRCQGPTEAGACPQGEWRAVPCAGCLIRPTDADSPDWPLWIPPGSRHCALGWNRRAALCLREAESCRDRWLDGLRREIDLVERRAARGDNRFKKRSPAELLRIAFWRWSHSPSGLDLSNAEETYRRRAQGFLAFARSRPYRLPEER